MKINPYGFCVPRRKVQFGEKKHRFSTAMNGLKSYLKLGKNNALLALILSVAITIAHLTGFIALEEQDLA